MPKKQKCQETSGEEWSRSGSPSSQEEVAQARQSPCSVDVMSEIIPAHSPIHSKTTPNTAALAEEEPTRREEEETPGEEESDDQVQTIAASTPLPPSPKKAKQKRQKQPSTSIAANMPPLQPIPLLICSIGNPGAQYANTLHSAGHNVIAALASYLSASPFTKDRAFGNGSVSHGSFSSAQPLWTLFQSPSYMNESGKPIAKAYQSWNKSLAPGTAGKLVIVHDELEKPLGSVSVREGQGLSARGHNGIKSLLVHMKSVPFVRVGVGIGRPVSREPNDVAKFVLKKMAPAERERVEGAAGEVMARLRVLSGG